MTPEQAAQAAAILVDRRLAGTQGDRLPESCRPYTLMDSLQLQDEVTKQWCERTDDTIGGWKCLLPPQDKIIVGPIYTRTIDSVPPVALWPKGELARIEPELAFIFEQDLPSRSEPYSNQEVDAAIGRTHLALELINCRYQDPSQCEFAEMLADGLVNQGLFIGPEVNSVAAEAAGDIALTLRYGDTQQELAGHHPNNAPRAPLYWLVEFLRTRGLGIVAGQAVITGSFAGVLEVPLNTPVSIEYAGLGQLEVSFTAKTAG